ncbi:MAG: hypothetical protein V4717_01050 [Bacteroidota bacterium]
MNWHLLYVTKLYTEAAIVKGSLEENDIPVQVLNKQDSMYTIALGHYELYVPIHLKDVALSVMNDALKN